MLLIGISIGYWAVLVTSIAEQFGTNLRATVTTIVPNFVRATVIPMSLGLEMLRVSLGLRDALIFLSVVIMVLAMGAARLLRESFFNDLDFIEH